MFRPCLLHFFSQICVRFGHPTSPSLSLPQTPILAFTASCPAAQSPHRRPNFTSSLSVSPLPTTSNLTYSREHPTETCLPSPCPGQPSIFFILSHKTFHTQQPGCSFLPIFRLPTGMSSFLSVQHPPQLLLLLFFFFHGRSESVLRTPTNGSFMKGQLSGSRCLSVV